MYIILTVEDFSKNAERLKELSGFIPAENIINLRNMDNGKSINLSKIPIIILALPIILAVENVYGSWNPKPLAITI